MSDIQCRCQANWIICLLQNSNLFSFFFIFGLYLVCVGASIIHGMPVIILFGMQVESRSELGYSPLFQKSTSVSLILLLYALVRNCIRYCHRLDHHHQMNMLQCLVLTLNYSYQISKQTMIEDRNPRAAMNTMVISQWKQCHVISFYKYSADEEKKKPKMIDFTKNPYDILETNKNDAIFIFLIFSEPNRIHRDSNEFVCPFHSKQNLFRMRRFFPIRVFIIFHPICADIAVWTNGEFQSRSH